MKPKDFRLDSVKDKDKKERTFIPEKNILHLLQQCMVDIRESKDQSIYKEWGIPYKCFEWCNVKIGGSGDDGVQVVFSVDRLDGALRLPKADSVELEKTARQTDKILETFISEFKKCFKKKSGKALTLSKVKKWPCQYEVIALNGLYRFVSRKSANVKASIDPQEYPSNYKDQKNMRE